MSKQYHVKKLIQPVDWVVAVPGSKSMTNRALLLGALQKGSIIIDGILLSEDSRVFLASLRSLGFELELNEEKKQVRLVGCGGKIPKQEAEIYVGSAGTAARFLTAMLGSSEGTYIIRSSEQMKRRPMRPLFELLEQLGAEITYFEEEYHLPVRITGCRAGNAYRSDNPNEAVREELDISKSTQFLSAMLLIAPMFPQGVRIHITSDKKDGSYVRITRKMMQSFGVEVVFNGTDYMVEPNAVYDKSHYIIEPDMSAACYFYAAAAVMGGRAKVYHVHSDNTQGDLKFLSVLEQLGCSITEEPDGIVLTGPFEGALKGIHINMNDFSDQTMTLAAIAPFCKEKVRIEGIGHIRLQESDRIHAIVTELTRLGVRCEEEESAITIYPGMPHAGIVQTYEDHRMAMAFSLIGLRTEGIVIDNPECCRKTFEQYFEVLDYLCGQSNK